ncbi:MAG: hydantoinase B/oxoprolinase family protein, partial [Theionarchaea archaeon]|nr:hydantoinase B/oxoprolinase family protein [Theionarchaea archaeon]
MDAVTLEILRCSLQSVAEEMGAVLGRTAFSPNIKER